MSKPNMLERIVKALPRGALEELARCYGNDRPWNADRKTLEILVISKDSEELRQELADIVRRSLLP